MAASKKELKRGKNIIICCDGTNNEIKADISNVLKLYRIAKKNEQQIVFYDPGIGTVGDAGAWSRISAAVKGFAGMATGAGLDDNIKDAYRFLMQNYEEGDQVYLFGFSRGAYTVRAFAGFLTLIGLLKSDQINMLDYAYTAYKRAAEDDDLSIGWRFAKILNTTRVPIKFLGVWDTVSSVMVPRPDRFYIPSFQVLPYSVNNPMVEVCRHACAIDERRRMFRLSLWGEQQHYKPNPFSTRKAKDQNIKQVWFAGVHSDVGGGYSESESGLAKFALKWMIEEAKKHGLHTNTAMFNHLVLGKERKGGENKYVSPDAEAIQHKSLTSFWWLLDIVPKLKMHREWEKRPSLLGLYIPFGEPRPVPDEALIHESVFARKKILGSQYNPPNLPSTYTIEPI